MKRGIVVLVGALVAIGLAGCGGGTPAPSGEPKTPAAASAEPTTDAPTAVEGEKDSRGYLIKKPGESASITGEDGGLVVEFTLSDFKPGFKCTDEYASKPANGQYLAVKVDMKAGTKAELEANVYQDSVSLSELFFSAEDADGKAVNDLGMGLTCVSSKEHLTADVKPEQSASGLLIFDVPKHGSLILTDYYGAPSGWVWKF